MPEAIGYSVGSGSLDDGWTAVTVGADGSYPMALEPPRRLILESVAVRLTEIDTASSVTLRLRRGTTAAKLSPGNTDGALADIELDDGSSTVGDAVWMLDDVAVVLEAGDDLVVELKLDGGTAEAVPRVTWRRR